MARGIRMGAAARFAYYALSAEIFWAKFLRAMAQVADRTFHIKSTGQLP
jgi:hypothetical protein